MPRSYPAPVQQNRHFSVLLGIIALGTLVALPCAALAQAYNDTAYASDSYDSYNTPPVDGDDDDAYYNSPDYIDEAGVPYAGRDLGYDYLDNEYYRYDGQPVQDRRAREQDGWRDGVLHTPPRGYRWRSWYDRGCGCTRGSYYRVYNSWGEHEYRQIYRGNTYSYNRGYSYDRTYDPRSSYSYRRY
ncbi:hypothetical protein AEAC466_08985 [Asticcacaulis sp. AC466]|uniref:hypothetical protein n=1 Tax=Asticcacaulis sp. AC466 TaxID=1282362 RepID=UPI0003C3DEF5|nr:hypothetical protein [Asticcacaulis sp. AC466]ESQ84477.1 hypothetical protein AEAC466_08985 [Asticcacaulis sp. AC466]